MEASVMAKIRVAMVCFMQEVKAEQAVMQRLLDHVDAFPAGGASPTQEDYHMGEEIISQGLISIFIRVSRGIMIGSPARSLALLMGATLPPLSRFPLTTDDLAESLALLPPPDRTSYPDCDDVGLDGFAMRLDLALTALGFAEQALDCSVDSFNDVLTLFIFTNRPLHHPSQREARTRRITARKEEARTSLATAIRCAAYAHAQATIALTRIAPPHTTTTPAIPNNIAHATAANNQQDKSA